MGRPLKIAKAQFLSMTGTSSSTNLVTVSNNLNTLNIIAGTPFTPNVSRGGLTAGTTYYILQVVTANTFSVSATDLSANPTYTPVTLTNSSTTTVLTVGAVDTGFSNPDGSNTSTNGTSYGAVGGNTGIYGSQTVARVAIGQNGTGTIYGDTANTVIYGSGTDFANTLSVGSAVQVASANAQNGSTDYTTVGFVATNTGYVTVAVANTSATGNVIGTSGNAQTLIVGAPVKFDANTGGLIAGTEYFVKSIANASAFTVSTTQNGATVGLTTGSVAANAKIDVTVLVANATANFTGSSFVFSTNEAGYIARQKGKQKYLVTGLTTGLTAQCITANVANAALTPNTMSILSTNAASGTAYVQSLSDYNTLLFSGSEANLQNATPVTATFGTAYAANTYGGQPYPIVTIANS